MSEQGLYDPNLFVATDESTWPGFGGPRYEVGWWWTFSVGGTFDTTPVSAGDRCYPIGSARQYDDSNYDEWEYENPAEGPFPIDQDIVTWQLVFVTGEPWFTDPAPSGGQRLHLVESVDEAADWKVAVDYWDEDADLWVEVTHAVQAVIVDAGDREGNIIVPPDEMVIEIRDDAGTVIPINPDKSEKPNVGDFVRCSVREPIAAGGNWYPLATCVLDRIDDTHDSGPRMIVLEAFGTIMDITSARVEIPPRVQETATQRLTWLLSPGGPIEPLWRWGLEPLPGTTDPYLVDAREQIQPAPAQGSGTYVYQHATSTAFPPPTTGDISQTSTQSARVGIHYTDSLGVDLSSTLQSLTPGDVLSTPVVEWQVQTVTQRGPQFVFSAGWDYEHKNGNPDSDKIWHQDSNFAEIRIHQVAKTGGNQGTNLATLGPGDTIAAGSQVWTIQSASQSGPVFTFIVDPSQRISEDEYTFTFTRYDPSPLEWVDLTIAPIGTYPAEDGNTWRIDLDVLPPAQNIQTSAINEIRNTAHTAGHQTDTTGRGQLRFRQFPLAGLTPVVNVVDSKGDPPTDFDDKDLNFRGTVSTLTTDPNLSTDAINGGWPTPYNDAAGDYYEAGDAWEVTQSFGYINRKAVGDPPAELATWPMWVYVGGAYVGQRIPVDRVRWELWESWERFAKDVSTVTLTSPSFDVRRDLGGVINDVNAISPFPRFDYRDPDNADYLATASDAASVAFYGARSRAYGFPLDNLLGWDNRTGADDLVARVLAAYSKTDTRVTSFDMDTRLEPDAAMRILVNADAGQQCSVYRLGFYTRDQTDGTVSTPISGPLEGNIVASTTRIEPRTAPGLPGRVRTTAYLSPLTETTIT